MSSNIPGTCGTCGGATGAKRVTRCKACYDDARRLARQTTLAATGERREAERMADLPAPSPRLPVDYDEAADLFRKIIGCTKRTYRGPAKKRGSSTQRIAIMGDLHAPFQNMKAFASFLERERGADVCIVSGDLQDHYSISRFTKYENVPIQQELAAAQLIMERLSETFPEVRVLEGNHDKPRLEKLLLERLPFDAVEIVRFLSRTGNLSTIEALCAQFTNVEHVKNKIDGRYSVSWYAQHGDLIVSHAEKFSRVPGSTLRSVEDWMSDFEGMLGLKPWRVLAQAHTHAQSLIPWGADKMLVEIGCMCLTMGYQLTARIGGRPQRVGWTTMTQTNGVTDLSSVHPFWWEKAA